MLCSRPAAEVKSLRISNGSVIGYAKHQQIFLVHLKSEEQLLTMDSGCHFIWTVNSSRKPGGKCFHTYLKKYDWLP